MLRYIAGDFYIPLRFTAFSAVMVVIGLGIFLFVFNARQEHQKRHARWLAFGAGAAPAYLFAVIFWVNRVNDALKEKAASWPASATAFLMAAAVFVALSGSGYAYQRIATWFRKKKGQTFGMAHEQEQKIQELRDELLRIKKDLLHKSTMGHAVVWPDGWSAESILEELHEDQRRDQGQLPADDAPPTAL